MRRYRVEFLSPLEDPYLIARYVVARSRHQAAQWVKQWLGYNVKMRIVPD